jgi:deoxyribonuclease-4
MSPGGRSVPRPRGTAALHPTMKARPRFGAHVSVAGGVSLAVPRAVALGCEAMQIFARNPNQWTAPPLDRAEAHGFREGVARAGLHPVVSHASYLINLASPRAPLVVQSMEALVDELHRAESLGLDGVVLHPGTRVAGETDEQALDRIAAALAVVFDQVPWRHARLLLEHTAGQGLSLGHRFEQLAGIIARLGGTDRVGVCLDTCHLLASGYDIASARGYAATMAAFHSVVGMGRLQAVHVNDSKRERGSRVDRHAHIGDGFIGIAGFRRLVNDPRLAGIGMVLETEKVPGRRPSSLEADPLDARNLAVLRGLVRHRRP